MSDNLKVEQLELALSDAIALIRRRDHYIAELEANQKHAVTIMAAAQRTYRRIEILEAALRKIAEGGPEGHDFWCIAVAQEALEVEV